MWQTLAYDMLIIQGAWRRVQQLGCVMHVLRGARCVSGGVSGAVWHGTAAWGIGSGLIRL